MEERSRSSPGPTKDSDARSLAAEGLVVYLGARDEDRGRAAAEQLRASGGDVRFLQLDVTEQAEIQAAVARVEAESSRLDVLVNNAGILLELKHLSPRRASSSSARPTQSTCSARSRSRLMDTDAAALGTGARREHEHAAFGSLSLVSDAGTHFAKMAMLAYS